MQRHQMKRMDRNRTDEFRSIASIVAYLGVSVFGLAGVCLISVLHGVGDYDSRRGV